MSELERNKGILYPLSKSKDELLAHYDMEDEGDLFEKNILCINGKFYQAAMQETSSDSLSDIEVCLETGQIHFHTIHHNGGACLEEVIEAGLLTAKERKLNNLELAALEADKHDNKLFIDSRDGSIWRMTGMLIDSSDIYYQMKMDDRTMLLSFVGDLEAHGFKPVVIEG